LSVYIYGRDEAPCPSSGVLHNNFVMIGKFLEWIGIHTDFLQVSNIWSKASCLFSIGYLNFIQVTIISIECTHYAITWNVSIWYFCSWSLILFSRIYLSSQIIWICYFASVSSIEMCHITQELFQLENSLIIWRNKFCWAL